jgi:hypothetical protein
VQHIKMDRLHQSKPQTPLHSQLWLCRKDANPRPVNPFAKRETHDAQTIFWYKIFTTLSWLLAVVSSVYYTFHAPDDDVTKQRTIWGQNRHHATAFALNSCIASIYW